MNDAFAKLIDRVRRGEAGAAEELFREYEPAVRLEVRMSLRFHSPTLRRRFDSADVCQSVMASLFLRLAVGQFELERPEQLLALLQRMAQNKLTDQVRRQCRARRDVRLTEPMSALDEADSAREADPLRTVTARELLREVRGRLNNEEQQVLEMRTARQSWQEIAAALGGTAESRRKQFHRAIDRVAAELGLPPVSPAGPSSTAH